MELTLTPSDSMLDVRFTLTSGQTFRWERLGEWWYGVVGRNVVKLRQKSSQVIFESHPETVDPGFIRSYFRLADDLPSIMGGIRKDPVISEAVTKFEGLRIMRQDPWECLISFLCATNSNIKVITQMISNLCKKFGERIIFEGREFYEFPGPKALARAAISDLTDCRVGYRAHHLRHTARQVQSGSVDLYAIRNLRYEEGRSELLKKSSSGKVLLGIGPKAADCILLFSMEKLESFPIDVWIKRLLVEKYDHLFDKKFVRRLMSSKSLGLGIYLPTADTMRAYFGSYAGYAQEYLYSYARSRVQSYRNDSPVRVTYSM